MNKEQQDKIGQPNAQIRHSEALAEESLLQPNDGAEMRSNEVKATINVHPHPTLLSFPHFPFFFSLPRKAFTLAEVLITLGIIGVVAAMTIPTLVNNYQKSQYVTGLKKAYTQFNQAIAQMTLEAGCVDDLKCTGFFATGTTTQSFGDEFVKYFKIGQNCQTTAGQGCWATATNQKYDGSGTGASIANFDSDTWWYKFTTLDGMSFAVAIQNDCALNVSNSTTGDLSQVCAFVEIDVNGPQKGPNYRGRDTFDFFMTNGHGAKIYPDGGSDKANGQWNRSAHFTCVPADTRGNNCAGRIIEEGWQMNY